jgi:hypothetical protein
MEKPGHQFIAHRQPNCHHVPGFMQPRGMALLGHELGVVPAKTVPRFSVMDAACAA